MTKLQVGSALFCILVHVATSPLATAAPGKQGVLGWSDAQFGSTSTRLEEKALEPFETSELDGLLLDGPRRASLRQGRGVPLVVIRGSSLRENATIDLEERGVLVTSRLEDDETLASRVFRTPDKSRQPDKLLPTEAPPPPSEIPEGHAVKLYRFVLTDQIPEIASRSGTWQTTLLLFDRRSNPVVTRIEAKPERKGKVARGSRPRPLDISVCRPRPDSPAFAGTPSIVLASPNKVETTWLVRGSFLLPTLARDLTDSSDITKAILPVTLILTGDHDATPILVPLRIPVERPLEGTSEEGTSEARLARGHFAVDLRRILGDQLSPQSYAVWAVSRQLVSQAVVVEVVTR
jgi:hypothetical protein